MHALPQVLTQMFDVLRSLVDETDSWSLLFLTAVTLFVGQHAVATHPTCRAWGIRVGGVSLVAGTLTGVVEGADALSAVRDATLFAGLVTGLIWMVAATVWFLFQKLLHRPVCQLRHLISCVRQRYRAVCFGWHARARQRQENRQWEQDAPQREQQQKQAERTKRQQQTFQKRRENARFTCRLLHDRHAAELQQRFSRQRLDEYFEQYMSDSHPIGEVESRALKLQELFQGLVNENGTNGDRFQNLVEIREFYQEQRSSVTRSTLDRETQQSLVADLAREEERMIREYRQQ